MTAKKPLGVKHTYLKSLMGAESFNAPIHPNPDLILRALFRINPSEREIQYNDFVTSTAPTLESIRVPSVPLVSLKFRLPSYPEFNRKNPLIGDTLNLTLTSELDLSFAKQLRGDLLGCFCAKPTNEIEVAKAKKRLNVREHNFLIVFRPQVQFYLRGLFKHRLIQIDDSISFYYESHCGFHILRTEATLSLTAM